MQRALVPARHPAAALLASQRPMAKLRFSHSSPATAPTASALLRKSDHGRRVAEGVHAPQFIAACPPRATENDEDAVTHHGMAAWELRADLSWRGGSFKGIERRRGKRGNIFSSPPVS